MEQSARLPGGGRPDVKDGPPVRLRSVRCLRGSRGQATVIQVPAGQPRSGP